MTDTENLIRNERKCQQAVQAIRDAYSKLASISEQHTIAVELRDRRIGEAGVLGVAMPELTKATGLTRQRVYQIVRHYEWQQHVAAEKASYEAWKAGVEYRRALKAETD